MTRRLELIKTSFYLSFLDLQNMNLICNKILNLLFCLLMKGTRRKSVGRELNENLDGGYWDLQLTLHPSTFRQFFLSLLLHHIGRIALPKLINYQHPVPYVSTRQCVCFCAVVGRLLDEHHTINTFRSPTTHCPRQWVCFLSKHHCCILNWNIGEIYLGCPWNNLSDVIGLFVGASGLWLGLIEGKKLFKVSVLVAR